MDILSIQNYSSIIANLYDGARKQSMEKFQYWTLEYLQRQLKFDAATWGIHNLGMTVKSRILYHMPDELVAGFESNLDEDGFVQQLAGAIHR